MRILRLIKERGEERKYHVIVVRANYEIIHQIFVSEPLARDYLKVLGFSDVKLEGV